MSIFIYKKGLIQANKSLITTPTHNLNHKASPLTYRKNHNLTNCDVTHLLQHMPPPYLSSIIFQDYEKILFYDKKIIRKKSMLRYAP